jgi:hypothetical protein
MREALGFRIAQDFRPEAGEVFRLDGGALFHWMNLSGWLRGMNAVCAFHARGS